MAREIVLDTETTGLDPRSGHRIIEIGCVELEDFLPTGRTFHCYVDPERDIDPDAERVHGISRASLAGQPRFADPRVVDAFTDFVLDATLVAHNAGFDRAFIDNELTLAGRPATGEGRWVDTLALAQKRFPGMYNSLDALCKRFRISLLEREKHGALVDAGLLAGVYLELRGGRERKLDLNGEAAQAAMGAIPRAAYGPRRSPLASRISGAERSAHEAFLIAELAGSPLWRALEPAAASGVADDLALGLGLAGQIDGGEVDRLEQEGGKAAFG